MTLTIQTCPANQAPMHLLLEADPDPLKIRRYLNDGLCRVAHVDGMQVGVYVLQVMAPEWVELMNIAVVPAQQGQGIGRQLLDDAISQARQLGARRLELGTGSFGPQLAFYQRAGFRVVAVEPDYFLEHYAEPLFEHGLQHKDRLRLALAL
ncbi:MAG: GNAT family N-acetyltransferase [Pseudomonas sp.]|uniref:GNAT family N-acetyltransferase n=1 Tax=Pseudomonas sp. TaxID=306 RepID=UPI003D0EA903